MEEGAEMKRPYHRTVDLMEVAGQALEAMVKKTKKNPSDLIREAIICHYGLGTFETTERAMRASEKKDAKRAAAKRGPITDEERRVVEAYKEAWSYTGRIHFPAVLAGMRQATAAGVSIDELVRLMEVAPHDDLLQTREFVALHELMSEKMISRLMTLEGKVREMEETKEALNLRDSLVPGAIRALRKENLLSPEVYRRIHEVETEEELKFLLKAVRTQ
jgi:hypothetical protein